MTYYRNVYERPDGTQFTGALLVGCSSNDEYGRSVLTALLEGRVAKDDLLNDCGRRVFVLRIREKVRS